MSSIWQRFFGRKKPHRQPGGEEAHPEANDEKQEDAPRSARGDPERDRGVERVLELLKSEEVPGLPTTPQDMYAFDATGLSLTTTGHFAVAYAASRALGNPPESAWGAALKDMIEKVTRPDDPVQFRVDDPVFRLFCEAYVRSKPGQHVPADIIGYFARLDEATFAQHVHAWFRTWFKKPRRQV
ncbi:MAG: hypothetical protein ABIP48_32945 [Planctomycetota bacterium]